MVVVVLVILAIAAGLLLSNGFEATGDCVYVFEGTTYRYPDYTEAECDAYCSNVRYGSCYWSGP
jgi:hypothetical protein